MPSPVNHRYTPVASGGDGGHGDAAAREVYGDALQSGATWGSEVTEADVVVEGEDQATPFVWFLVCTAAISGLLFGYDTGVISGTLVGIRADLGHALSAVEKEVITSATTLGALLGGLVAGALADVLGRKRALAWANAVFVAGALWQAASGAVRTLVAGRLVVGLAVGIASCVAPLYIGELAPTRLRGKLVTVNVVAITLGQVIAYAIGAAFEQTPSGWRYMVGIGAVPAVIQLCAFTILPESPRILLARGRRDKAAAVLARVYPLASKYEIARKADVMDRAAQQLAALERDTPWAARAGSLVRVGSNRRALIVGSALQALQQLCGFNTLMYYSATLFAQLGFRNATATGLLIAAVNFGATLVALRVIDTVGRRRIMLYSVPGMVAALAAAAVCFHYLTRETGGVLVDGHAYARTPAALVLAATLAFVAAYALGCGNVPWQQGELFRLEVRGLGTGVCTAVCWLCNLVVAATFLSLIHAISPAGAFALYAAVTAAGGLFVWACYPETAGLGLDDVCALFQDGWGVEQSLEIWDRRRAADAKARGRGRAMLE